MFVALRPKAQTLISRFSSAQQAARRSNRLANSIHDRALAADPPLKQLPAPGGLLWDVYGKALPQAGAEAFCVGRGGHLVALDSQEKTDLFVEKVMPALPNNDWWIGLWSGGAPTVKREDYRWYSGADPTYQNWAGELGGQPDNYQGHQGVCVMAVRRLPPNYWPGWSVPASWDDTGCGVPSSFVCEVRTP